MIRNYFWVIHIIIEKIIVEKTQPVHDILGMSPEGPYLRKLMILWKNCFSEVTVPVLHICFCFLQEEQIFKISKRRHPRYPNGTQLWDVPGS